MKKRLIPIIIIIALVFGLRFLDNGLLNIKQGGRFTVFHSGGGEMVFKANERPSLDRFSGYTRLDTFGTEQDMLEGLNDLDASVLWTESIDGILIVYAYSPSINKYEIVHNQKVNVMAAAVNGKISYGSPLLKGSY